MRFRNWKIKFTHVHCSWATLVKWIKTFTQRAHCRCKIRQASQTLAAVLLHTIRFSAKGSTYFLVVSRKLNLSLQDIQLSKLSENVFNHGVNNFIRRLATFNVKQPRTSATSLLTLKTVSRNTHKSNVGRMMQQEESVSRNNPEHIAGSKFSKTQRYRRLRQEAKKHNK